MDHGAHFHPCDFQVHTPRDQRWHGLGATSDAERELYADELISSVRDKGLDAIAVTDHHDMTMIPYVRAAAAREALRISVSSEMAIRVFPGMELTLGVPCQAILLFDADFPDDLFHLVYAALAITPSPAENAQAADPVRLGHILSLAGLHAELNKHEYLRNRYIVLPNVSKGGPHTLLRTGHASHYREMPCVGGYVDGSITQLGIGNTRILAGQDPQYGSRSLGVFATSDTRRRDFSDLGSDRTWVKWSEPTAEALRQACLARQSRIAHSEPELPNMVITQLDISNSQFLGPVSVELNPQFYALIGGRGTGKSSLLEYLRYGLCDDPPAADDDIEAGDPAAKRRSLIEKTLKPHRGGGAGRLYRQRSPSRRSTQFGIGRSVFENRHGGISSL